MTSGIKRIRLSDGQKECVSTRLDVHSVPPFESSITKSYLLETPTYSSMPRLLKAGGSLDFSIEASGLDFFSLKDSYLCVEVDVTKLDATGKEVPLVDGVDKVSLAPLVPLCLFRQLQVRFNDVNLIPTVDNYLNMESYLQSVLHLSEPTCTNIMETACPWFSKNPGVLDPDGDDGLRERYALTLTKQKYITPVLHPLFLTERIYPNETEINLSFVLNSESSCISWPPPPYFRPANEEELATDPETKLVELVSELPQYQVKLTSAKFYLQRVRLSSPAVTRYEKTLRTGALFPMKWMKTISYTISRGMKEHSKILTLSKAGIVPSMLYVYMIERDSIESYTEDGYKFDDFGLRSMSVEVGDSKFPQNIGYSQRFDVGDYSHSYYMMKKQLGQVSNSHITKQNWDSGFNYYVFNLSGDGSDGCGYISQRQNDPEGPLIINTEFGPTKGSEGVYGGLLTPVTVFITCEFTRVLKIDSKRVASWLDE